MTGESDPKQPTAQELLEDAIAQVEYFGEESVTYDRDTISRAYTDVTRYADQALQQKELDQTKSVEVKLEATKRVREIAAQHSDALTADMMTQLESTYTTLIDVLKPAAKKPRRRASTSRAKTGAAKSSAAT